MSNPKPPLRVLVVEDDRNSRAVLEQALKLIDADLVTAETGEQALLVFRPGLFDVVLLDLKLPGIDGHQTARQMRALEKQSQEQPTPIVAISGFTREVSLEESRAAGVDFRLSKPVNVPALLETIEAATTPL